MFAEPTTVILGAERTRECYALHAARPSRSGALPELLDHRAEVSFLESFRAIAAHEAEVLFFGAAGQHLWVLGADDIAGLVVEEGGNEADEIVACSPHHPRQTSGRSFKRAECAG